MRRRAFCGGWNPAARPVRQRSYRRETLCCFSFYPLVRRVPAGDHVRQGRRVVRVRPASGSAGNGLGQESVMCATALEIRDEARSEHLVNPCAENVDSATRLFTVLAPLHELNGRDAELLARAAAGHRFIPRLAPLWRHQSRSDAGVRWQTCLLPTRRLLRPRRLVPPTWPPNMDGMLGADSVTPTGCG